MKSLSQTERPNILIIVMDATRARQLSSYGYKRETSPNVDQVAAQGVLYEECIAPASWTLPAMASLFTGLHVSQHGTNFGYQYLEPQFTTIAEVLRGHNYQTALFSAGGWVSETFGMNRGFDACYNYVDGIAWMRRFFKKPTPIEKLLRLGKYYLLGGRRGKMTYETVRDVRRWFEKDYDSDRPFFILTHIGDPHWPWFHHPQFSWVDGSRKPPRVFAPDWHKWMAGELVLSEADRKMIVDFYDGEISFMDSYIGRMLNSLRAGGHLDNTLVVITADHGEELTEHGLMGHGLSAYENVLHVPLILYHRDHFTGGQRVSEPVQTLDLFPTILELLNINRQTVPNPLAGRSLQPDKVQADPRPFTISERLTPNLRRFQRVCPNYDTTPLNRHLRALRLRADKYKLIWGSDGNHELYNLAQDPNEMKNLASDELDKVQLLEAQVEAWLSAIDAAQFGQRELEMDEVVLERLRDLGYI